MKKMMGIEMITFEGSRPPFSHHVQVQSCKNLSDKVEEEISEKYYIV